MGVGNGGCVSVIPQQERRKTSDWPTRSDVWDLLPHMPGCAVFLLCPVVLSAPDTVLIERNLGKRIDPQTGGMPFHPHPTPWSFRAHWSNRPAHHLLNPSALGVCAEGPVGPQRPAQAQRLQAGLGAGSHLGDDKLQQRRSWGPQGLKEERWQC